MLVKIFIFLSLLYPAPKEFPEIEPIESGWYVSDEGWIISKNRCTMTIVSEEKGYRVIGKKIIKADNGDYEWGGDLIGLKHYKTLNEAKTAAQQWMRLHDPAE